MTNPVYLLSAALLFAGCSSSAQEPANAAVVVRDTRFASVGESRAVGDRLYDSGIEAVGIAENFVTQPELSFL